MSLTSPEDIEKWFQGTQLYDEGDVEGALKSFTDVTQNSRILFNVGCCYLTNNDIKAAAEVGKTLQYFIWIMFVIPLLFCSFHLWRSYSLIYHTLLQVSCFRECDNHVSVNSDCQNKFSTFYSIKNPEFTYQKTYRPQSQRVVFVTD